MDRNKSEAFRTEDLTKMQEDIIEEFAQEPGIGPRAVSNQAMVSPEYASLVLREKFEIVQSRSRELGQNVTRADFNLRPLDDSDDETEG